MKTIINFFIKIESSNLCMIFGRNFKKMFQYLRSKYIKYYTMITSLNTFFVLENNSKNNT